MLTKVGLQCSCNPKQRERESVCVYWYSIHPTHQVLTKVGLQEHLSNAQVLGASIQSNRSVADQIMLGDEHVCRNPKP